jgi:hypothetical protein
MRVINLRIDDNLFTAMKLDKESRGFESWELYIAWLFNGRKTNG